MPPALMKIEKVQRQLAECVSVDEAKDIHDRAKALRAYFKSQKISIEMQQQAGEIAVRAERRMGELLRDSSPGGGKPKEGEKPFLEKVGLSKAQSHQAQKLAAVEESEISARMEALRESGKPITRTAVMSHTASTSHDGDEWGTPSEYIERARSLMGSIDLDPATNEFAQETVQASTAVTKGMDGLGWHWTGNVWLNPPYSKGLIEQFVEKAVGSIDTVESMVILVNSATETEWYQKLLSQAAALLVKGRISFLDPTGRPISGNNRGQTFFFFGLPVLDIQSNFGDCGTLVGAYR